MALVACPECGKSVSSEASSCPHCGYKKNPYVNPDPWTKFSVYLSLFALVAIIVVVIAAVVYALKGN